jgi:uncharacterized protein YbaP (TraB family)|tara:strand:+ start:1323 stop:2291 length:969 start_codon:yes stop_codon:yes gene_type:complete
MAKDLPFAWKAEYQGNVSYLIGTMHYPSEPDKLSALHQLIDASKTVYVEKGSDFTLPKRAEYRRLRDGRSTLFNRSERNKVESYIRQQLQDDFSEEIIASYLSNFYTRKSWSMFDEISSLVNDPLGFKHQIASDRRTAIEEATKKEIIKNSGGPIPKSLSTEYAAMGNIMNHAATTENEKDNIIDLQLMSYALSQEKVIRSLDEGQSTVEIEDSIPESVWKKLIWWQIDPGDRNTGLVEMDEADYWRGDIDYFKDAFAELDEDMRMFNDAICDGRNNLWYPKVLDDLKQGDKLIAVGLNHLISETGFTHRLPQDGFSVTRID